MGEITSDSLERSNHPRQTGGDPSIFNQETLMNHPSDELSALHDHYVEAVNMAVAEDDLVRVTWLSAEYEREALALMRAEMTPAA